MCALLAAAGMEEESRLAEQEEIMVEPSGVPIEISGDVVSLSTAGASSRKKLLEQPESIIALSQGGCMLTAKVLFAI